MRQAQRYELYMTRIREMREEAHVSQEKIGIYLNVVQKTYSDYENGRLRMPISQLIKLGKFYDVSMDYITGVSNIRGHFPTE